MVGGIVEGDHIHPLYRFDQLPELLCSFVGDIGHHDPGGPKGDEIGIHRFQALPGFRILGQVGGHIVLHLYPVHGKNAEDESEDVQQKE